MTPRRLERLGLLMIVGAALVLIVAAAMLMS
jgi:hypothetical protein